MHFYRASTISAVHVVDHFISMTNSILRVPLESDIISLLPIHFLLIWFSGSSIGLMVNFKGIIAHKAICQTFALGRCRSKWRKILFYPFLNVGFLFDVGKDRFQISRGSKQRIISHDMDNGKVRKGMKGLKESDYGRVNRLKWVQKGLF